MASDIVLDAKVSIVTVAKLVDVNVKGGCKCPLAINGCKNLNLDFELFDFNYQNYIFSVLWIIQSALKYMILNNQQNQSYTFDYDFILCFVTGVISNCFCIPSN